MPESPRPIAVALTGASGMPYALRLIEVLVQARRPLYLLYSQAAQVVMKMEAGIDLPGTSREAEAMLAEKFGALPGMLRVFGRQQWTAPVASGSNPPGAMVVVPCTTGTLASIAAGICDDLIDRAADVMLKEQRRLILVVRETPFSSIHLENMLRLARAGAVIMPANPGFYFQPDTVADLVDFMVGRILDQLGIDHALTPRWGAEDLPAGDGS
ncbi:MAG: flavin prenyltransferase UbiX [Pseudomonadota bacterium]